MKSNVQKSLSGTDGPDESSYSGTSATTPACGHLP